MENHFMKIETWEDLRKLAAPTETYSKIFLSLIDKYAELTNDDGIKTQLQIARQYAKENNWEAYESLSFVCSSPEAWKQAEFETLPLLSAWVASLSAIEKELCRIE